MKDWRVWVLLIGLYLVVKMCGGCEGCSGCSSDDSSNGMRKCQNCGKSFEPTSEDDEWCHDCYSNHSKQFNKQFEEREKAIHVRPY